MTPLVTWAAAEAVRVPQVEPQQHQLLVTEALERLHHLVAHQLLTLAAEAVVVVVVMLAVQVALAAVEQAVKVILWQFLEPHTQAVVVVEQEAHTTQLCRAVTAALAS